MEKPLKDIVKDKMHDLKIGIPELAEATGIPAPRIYKWYSKNRPASPKEGDSKTLKEWLRNSSISSINVTEELRHVQETKKESNMASEPQALEQAIKNLSESNAASNRIIEALTESRLIDSRNMERLITLLEVKIIGDGSSRFVNPGVTTTETLVKQKEQAK